MQLLAYATDYWSKGTIKALFLEHEVSLVFLNSNKSSNGVYAFRVSEKNSLFQF